MRHWLENAIWPISIWVVVVASALTVARSAQALVLTCSFTEPFFHTYYVPSQNLLVLAMDYNDDYRVQKWRVARHMISKRVFELRTTRNQLIERTSRDWSGSDGMSDDGGFNRSSQHG